MKDFKKLNGSVREYDSLEELGKAWKCKPAIKQTKDKAKLKEQRERFCEKYKCKGCGKPMSYIEGGIMVCTNEECKGIKNERKDKEGNPIVTYSTSYLFLRDKKSKTIAENIFAEI